MDNSEPKIIDQNEFINKIKKSGALNLSEGSQN